MKTLKRLIKYGILLLIGCFLVSGGMAITVSTTDVSSCLQNWNFDQLSLSVWTEIFNPTYGTISLTTVSGRTVVRLGCFYTNSSQSYPVTLSMLSESYDTTEAHNLTHDVIILYSNTIDAVRVRLWIRGDPSYGDSTITGKFSCELSCAVATDIIKEKVFLQSVSADSVICRMADWYILSFTFPAHNADDWWKIRGINVTYEAAPNQKVPTAVLIDQIRLETLYRTN